MKIALMVRSLERGGAERQLVMLARGLKDLGVKVMVISFYDGGAFKPDLDRAGIPVFSLHKTGRWDLANCTARVLRLLLSERPDVLYGFVVTPNLLGTAVKPFVPGLRVIWGIRSARIDLSAYDWVTRVVYKLEARLSRLPDLIIVNSMAGANQLRQRGFPQSKVRYVPNGIDVERYRPDPEGRARLRAAWGVGDAQLLVGMIARADPVKAHDVFLEAAQVLARRDERLLFRCIGVDDLAARNIREQVAAKGLTDRVAIEGPRDDLAAVYSALDVHVMCSHSEGFPNVVAEAMACGVPCAVTNAGDAIEIVGDTGEHAPVANPEALAKTIQNLFTRVANEGGALGERARARIVENYSIMALANRTLEELKKTPESVGS